MCIFFLNLIKAITSATIGIAVAILLILFFDKVFNINIDKQIIFYYYILYIFLALCITYI
jgi:hypothetical protein